MPTHMVNLEALIPRDDFEIPVDNKKQTLQQASMFKMVELEEASIWFKWLRKPDFQRTTAHWSRQR